MWTPQNYKILLYMKGIWSEKWLISETFFYRKMCFWCEFFKNNYVNPSKLIVSSQIIHDDIYLEERLIIENLKCESKNTSKFIANVF